MSKDYLHLFRLLNEENIQYIVCGGLAVNMHGVPRTTYDIDLLLNMEGENLNSFLSLMKQLNFSPRVPVNMMDFAEKETRDKWIREKNMKAFTLRNEDWNPSEIDIVFHTNITYKFGKKNQELLNIDNLEVPVISIQDLINMKQNTGRKQDQADIQNLKKILEDQNE